MTNAPVISDAVVEAALNAYRDNLRDYDGTLQHDEAMYSAITAAVLAEREECAKVAAMREGEWHSDLADGCARDIAAAIRARSTGGKEMTGFPEALRDMIDYPSHAFRRASWRFGRSIHYVFPDGKLPYLEIKTDEGRAPYVPAQCDMRAEDWVRSILGAHHD